MQERNTVSRESTTGIHNYAAWRDGRTDRGGEFPKYTRMIFGTECKSVLKYMLLAYNETKSDGGRRLSSQFDLTIAYNDYGVKLTPIQAYQRTKCLFAILCEPRIVHTQRVR
jgi:hypothetical protein